MPASLSLLGVLALGLCAATAATATMPGPAAVGPWAACVGGEPATPSEALRTLPASAKHRLEWVISRPIDEAGSPEVVAILASLARWGAGRPAVCLQGAEYSWFAWRASGRAELGAVGDELLRAYLQRTPSSYGVGIEAWMRLGDPKADPRRVFSSLPPPLAARVGGALIDTDPDAAWDLLRPALTDLGRPWEETQAFVERALAAARRRRNPADGEVLLAAVARAECPTDLRQQVEQFARDARREAGR